MGFRRQIEPDEPLGGEALTAAMVNIGMLFAAESGAEANIEDVLLAASLEGMEGDDLRVLSVLTTWLGVHLPRVNVGRLTQLLKRQQSERVRGYWTSIARWHRQDSRMRKVEGLHDNKLLDLLPVGTDFQLKRRGFDERFADGPLRVPAGTLRDRAADILTPSELARNHRAYHHRVLIGPTYRADMWALLERDPQLSPTALARQTYGSFSTAWQVKRDFNIIAEPQIALATA